MKTLNGTYQELEIKLDNINLKGNLRLADNKNAAKFLIKVSVPPVE